MLPNLTTYYVWPPRMGIEANKVGRPTLYTPELADHICELLAGGESMRAISRDESMPAMSTLFKWLRENEVFSQQYAKAKEESADALTEEILDIADDGTNDWIEKYSKEGEPIGYQLNGEAVARSRLRVDTRKWIASKLKPKKYGDKIDMTSDGEKLGVTLSADQADQLIRARAKRSTP